MIYGQLPIILKIKLWGDDGGGWGRRWWSFGELGIRQHRLILAVENQSPSRICQTCRRHTNATTAAAASAYPSMMLSSLLFSSLLFSSLLFSSLRPSPFLLRARVRVSHTCMLAYCRDTHGYPDGSRSRTVYPQSIKATCQHEYQKRGR